MKILLTTGLISVDDEFEKKNCAQNVLQDVSSDNITLKAQWMLSAV